jgi:hypothetical protein
MSCAWTILFVMPCFIVLVWIRNCFLDRKNSGSKRHLHMDERNIKIRSLPTQHIIVFCYRLHTRLFPVISCLIVPCLIFSSSRVVSHGKGTYGRTMLFFCMGLGLIASQTMSEALVFRPQSVLGYAIDNNLLGSHGWSRVRILAQKTSDEKMLDKIRRRVVQMEKAHKIRMKPKAQASPEVVVPGDIMGVEKGPAVDSMEEEEGLSPDFIKHYTRLKWECLRTRVSLAVLQYPFPKPLLYKQLKENLLLHQIVITLSRQKTRHLKKHGKQEPLCAMPLDEYELITSTQQFAFEKAIEAEHRWSKLSLNVCHICDRCHFTKMSRTMVEFGHTNQREQNPICGSCAYNPARNTAQNRAITYWIDRHGTIHTYVPRELNDLTFAEKQLIALAYSHVSLIHLKNGTLGSRGAFCQCRTENIRAIHHPP